MEKWKSSIPPFWIRDKDDLGRPVDPDVLRAAKQIWPQVLRVTESKLNDGPRAAEVLELAAFAVTRTLRRQRHEPIRDLNSYLFWACLRRLDRIARKERREQSGHDLGRLEFVAEGGGDRWVEKFFDGLLLEELLSSMDDRTRRLFAYRCQGYSWQATAEKMGYASGHSAEVQFWKGLKAAGWRLSPRLAPVQPQSPKEAD